MTFPVRRSGANPNPDRHLSASQSAPESAPRPGSGGPDRHPVSVRTLVLEALTVTAVVLEALTVGIGGEALENGWGGGEALENGWGGGEALENGWGGGEALENGWGGGEAPENGVLGGCQSRRAVAAGGAGGGLVLLAQELFELGDELGAGLGVHGLVVPLLE